MKILADRRIKLLSYRIMFFIVVFSMLSVALIMLGSKNAAWYVLVSCLCMDILISAAGYWHFKEQDKIMENAAMQIKNYISGDRTARIDCDHEGGAYRLFHEINSLVCILDAHVENEGNAKRFLKDTISDISHQLKTPLAALNVYNGILQEEAKDLPTIQEFAVLSGQELDRIDILVQNLLKITKLDAGTIVIEKAIENVSEMISSIERRFSYRAEQEEKEICLSGDDTVSLSCDHDRLVEAIGNIVKNAFDHTKKGDIICIEWKRYASIVQIIVKDSGSGIHPEDLYHIFKRFYRSRFSKDTQGIGLGLPLAKSIIEAHNGTIEVDSELGRGTIFTIDLLIPTKL